MASVGEVLYAARADVNVEQLGEKFVVQDPLKNSFIQLGVAEYIVFHCFDGKSTTQDIADRLRREREVIVSPAHVARLRDRLHEKQLVLAPGETVKAEDVNVAADARGIVRLVMIDLRLAFNPDIFLTRLYHRIKYVVFRPAFFVALAVLVGLAMTVWLQSWSEIRMQAATLEAGRSLIMYYLCFSVSVLAHEVAHGVATKGFGGKVPKMGAFLYFFLLVFYTDVSSSWMFASKFRRLMVLFAGALANIAICAIATLLWRSTMQGSLLNDVFFALMMINAVAASFTLFPLLRGDGYYILSTALNIPNLRQNAYRYAGAVFRRMLIDHRAELPKASNRESLIYVVYAPLQILFFIVFFGYVAIHTAEWLIGELGFVGFWIIAIVVADRLARPVFRIVPGALALAADALRLGLAHGPRALLALLARPLRDGARWVIRMWKLELVIGAAIAVLAMIPYHLHISAPVEVISSGPVAVTPRTGGIVEAYAVQTGAWVEAGDVVAQLVDDDLALQRQTMTAELDHARARLAELEAGNRREDVARARAGAGAQWQARVLAGTELRRTRNLYRSEMASRDELEAAERIHRVARAQQWQAHAELRLVNAGARPEEIERQRAAVVRAELELAAVEQRLEWTKVRALSAGRVVTPAHELVQRIGKHVAAGDSVVEIVAPDHLVARLEVPERFISDVELGMPVELRFFKDPDVAHAARLDAIEAAVTVRAGEAAGALGMLSALSHLDSSPPLGATGIAKVHAGSQSILGLFLRRCHRAAAVIFWSWW